MPAKRIEAAFTDTDLRSLAWAYSRARKDLDLGQGPSQGMAPCERLAHIVFQIAAGGERNPEAIRRRAAMRFANLSFSPVGVLREEQRVKTPAASAAVVWPSTEFLSKQKIDLRRMRAAIAHSRRLIETSAAQLAESSLLLAN